MSPLKELLARQRDIPICLAALVLLAVFLIRYADGAMEKLRVFNNLTYQSQRVLAHRRIRINRDCATGDSPFSGGSCVAHMELTVLGYAIHDVQTSVMCRGPR